VAFDCGWLSRSSRRTSRDRVGGVSSGNMTRTASRRCAKYPTARPCRRSPRDGQGNARAGCP
jgi:hypothetical protein